MDKKQHHDMETAGSNASDSSSEDERVVENGVAAPPAAAAPANLRRRAKPGRKALADIKKIQKTNNHVIPREAIRRYIAEVVQGLGGELCIATEAVEALRTVAEAAITQTFGLAGSLANELSGKDTVGLSQFRAAANILFSDNVLSTAGLSSGALTAPLS